MTTKDDQLEPLAPWSADFARQSGQERERARVVSESKRDTLKKLEARLTERLQSLAEELAREQARSEEVALEHARRTQQVEEQTTELGLHKQEFLARQKQFERLQAETIERQSAVFDELNEKHKDLDRRQEELARETRRLLEERHALDRERMEMLADFERRRAEIEVVLSKGLPLDAELEELRAERHRLHERLIAAERQLAERPDAAADLAQRWDELRCHFDLTAQSLKEDQVAQQQQWERLQAEAAERQAAALAELANKGLPLDAEVEELRTERSRLHERLIEAEKQLAERPEAAASEALRWEELKCHLELTAESLKEDQAARQKQWERLHAETSERQSAALAELTAQHKELGVRQEELARESQRLLEEKSAFERQKTELLADLDRRRSDVAEAADKESSLDRALATELEELRSQRKRLQERLAEAERKLEEQPAAPAVDEHQLDDLRRRFEMAVEDLREAKNENADLKRELAASHRGSSAPSPGGATNLGSDWESQKKRLMQQLEEGFDDGGGSAKAAESKLTVEGAIRITDQMVVEKEREIQELKRLLDDQSSNIGGLAVGATAIAAVLDQDELIREERESLKRIQDEWRDKLRQAEVDISLERAKLARERAEMEDKLQRHAASAKHDVPGDAGSDKSKKPRRWLSLLVKESEER